MPFNEKRPRDNLGRSRDETAGLCTRSSAIPLDRLVQSLMRPSDVADDGLTLNLSLQRLRATGWRADENRICSIEETAEN